MKRLAACLVAAFAAVGFTLTSRETATVTVHEREWSIALSTSEVPTGTVTFHVYNDGAEVHDFSILGRTTPPLHANESATLTVTFSQPGQYVYVSTRDDTDVEMNGVLDVRGAPLATTTEASATTVGRLPLEQVASIPLSDGRSRFDYQSLSNNRLYLAHMGAGHVDVVDVRTRRVVGDVGGTPDVHGVLAVPSLGRVFATGSGRLVAIRGSRVVGSAPAGRYPDGLAYDPVHERVFVSDEHGGAVDVVDARRLHRVAVVPLGGAAGNVAYDATTRRMLVAVAGQEELAELTTKPARVVVRHPLLGCKGAHGVQLDVRLRLAFVACEDDDLLFVVDLQAHVVSQTFPVGATPDVLALDPGLHRLYVAAESGVVAVFAEQGRTLSKLGQAFLADHAHSVAVDPRTHLVYFPLEGPPALRVMRPATLKAHGNA